MAQRIEAPTQGIQDYAHAAAEKMRDTSQAAMESLRSGYESSEEFISERPLESMAVALGAGFIIGGLIARAIHLS